MAPMKYSVFPCAGHSIFHLCHLSTESMKKYKVYFCKGRKSVIKDHMRLLKMLSHIQIIVEKDMQRSA